MKRHENYAIRELMAEASTGLRGSNPRERAELLLDLLTRAYEAGWHEAMSLAGPDTTDEEEEYARQFEAVQKQDDPLGPPMREGNNPRTGIAYNE